MEELPEIIDSKRSWIENALIWADEQRRQVSQQPPIAIPAIIDLPAVSESWQLQRIQTEAKNSRVRESGFRKLRVSGNIHDTGAVADALKRWLSRRAKLTLVPRLHFLAASYDFAPVRKTTVRNQQTCWASYSPSGMFSINQKLLFLPAEQLDYILIHELCHTVHLNHSRRFWRLVGRFQPRYSAIRRELSSNQEIVPRWASE
jgi:hypothetical protein